MNTLTQHTWILENADNFDWLSRYCGEYVDTAWVVHTLFQLPIPSKSNKKVWMKWANTLHENIGMWWESRVQRLIPYSRITESKCGYDIKKWNLKVETKTAKHWNATMLKLPQAERLTKEPWDIYYAFVYYGLRWWVSRSADLPRDARAMHRHLMQKNIFIFPISYIIYLLNILPSISTVNVPFKKVHQTWVSELYQLAQQRWDKTSIINDTVYVVGDIIDYIHPRK